MMKGRNTNRTASRRMEDENEGSFSFTYRAHSLLANISHNKIVGLFIAC